MIPSEQRNHIDKIWNRFKPVSSFKPFAVIELIGYMFYLKRLDEIQTLKENHPILVGEPIVNPVFTPDESELRWHNFKDLEPQQLYQLFTKENGVFQFGKRKIRPESTYNRLLDTMDVMFPTSGMLADLVEMISGLEIKNQEQTGAIFDYLLSKPETAGENNQFSTPQHITRLMVELAKPSPADIICDPAAGTGGLLLTAANYIKKHFPDSYLESEFNCYFPAGMFSGFDSDETMLRIAAINLMIHGIEDPLLSGINALGKSNNSFAEKFSLILSTPPFTGSMDINEGDAAILKEIKSRKANLRYLALISKGLKKGGRAVVIVPQEVLYGATAAHIQVRKMISDNQKLEAVISLPEGVFNPYSKLPGAIVLFSNRNSSPDDLVWFYRMETDGLSANEERIPINEMEGKSFPVSFGDIPALLDEWKLFRESARMEISEKCFSITCNEVRSANYDWSPEAYRKLVQEKIKQKAKPGQDKNISKKTNRIAENENDRVDAIAYEPYPESTGKWKSVTTFILLFLLIFAGVFGYYFFIEKPKQETNPATIKSTLDTRPEDAGRIQTSSGDSVKKDTPISLSEPPRETDKAETDPANDSIGQTEETKEPEPITEEAAPKPRHAKPVVKKELGRYKVITKAYFHDRPNEEYLRAEEFVIHWDNAYTTLQAIDEKNGFIYVVFTNSNGETIRGWLKKEDLRPVE